MRNLLISSLAPFAIGAVVGFFLTLLNKGASKLVLILSGKPKLAALAPIIPVGEKAADAALQVAGSELGKKNLLSIVKDVGKAAEAVVVANKDTLESAASAELKVLVDGPAQLTVTTEGGATVNLPKAD